MATGFDDAQLTALGVRRLNPDTDPQELVLPEASEERLQRIAGWLTQPPPVLREWGLHRFIDGGLRALFRGPSGTGKTMAAIVIARWADRPLYRVDPNAHLTIVMMTQVVPNTSDIGTRFPTLVYQALLEPAFK